ncbi:MAG: Gfo/Idh/MocA family oxidoreductase [Betaproteobacteria bacterium AqS2]|uniref:Gfo/Idh/MocA family oxidoreductase n=1 Tax=Candidatus Amphirhobacter heronislandensis TaxID=1732024 RepID=A0A930Y159_9GAMM|nr:Gfo/Idh/MocA family oxidoreductase [Betaproteobacteria bacterium AqS2]
MADSKQEQKLRRLRLGMVGGGITGHIGAAHRIAAAMHGLYDLAAGAFSSDPAVCRASGEAFGLDPQRCYDDYEQMFAKEAQREDGIEAVAIVTPNDLHAGPAIAAAEAGVDVLCDKPLAESLARTIEVEQAVAKAGVVFVLTHNYSGYPLVRQARQMVAEGLLGELRQTRIEYLQDGALRPLPPPGPKTWKGRPERCGPAGCIADIGSHAYHMLRFVTGADAVSLSCATRSHSPSRVLDDHCETLLRHEGEALGSMTCAQVSVGKKCDLNFHVYGDKGSLHWGQEEPNEMLYCPYGEPKQVLQRGMPYLGPAATPRSNIAPGHTEGYYEAFAQLYVDGWELIRARREGREPPATAKLAPNARDGVAVARYIGASVESAAQDGAWVELASVAP